MKDKAFLLALLALVISLGVVVAAPRLVPARAVQPAGPVSAGFTYQGRLELDGGPVTASCDLQFALWDAASGGTQVGGLQQVDSVAVSLGVFTVLLNEGGEFGGNAFAGEARWLAIAVRCPAGTGTFTPLDTRQPLSAVPYALYAVAAGEAAGSAYAGVVVVAAGGGDFTSIQAALDSVSATETQRYLVWVAPGVYTETVAMKPYVDITGAGEGLTRIVSPGAPISTTGTVRGASDAGLRSLTVENTGGNTYAVAIYNALVMPRLSDVTARATGGDVNIAVFDETSESEFINVTALAVGGARAYGMYVANGMPVLLHVAAGAAGATSGYGLFNDHATPALTSVTFTATATSDAYGLYNLASAPQVSVATFAAAGGARAYGMYNTAGATPVMDGVIATATDAAQANYGVYTDGSAPALTGLTAEAMGGADSYAVYNVSAMPVFNNLTANAAAATNNYGVYNEASAATIGGCVIAALGGVTNYGIYNAGTTGSYAVHANQCQITAATRTVRNDTAFATRVGDSQLAGGAVGGTGSLQCAGVYDENYVFSAGPACP
jgi:hypothetical protein